MKTTVDIKPYELDEYDTICGYRLKDVCLIAKCMEESGVTKEDVAKFIREFERVSEILKKEYEKVFTAEVMFQHICQHETGGEE